MSKDKIVLDHGSYNIRYGFAGYDKPDGKIRSLVVKDDNDRFVDVDENFINGFNDMELIYPIKNGVINNFKEMIYLWDCIFFEKLNIKPKKCSILITEPNGVSQKVKSKIKKIMFRKYKFKKIQFCSQEIVSLYGSGRSTGIVLDMGHTITKCVPVYDSYIITNGIKRSNLAGKRMNGHIISKLKFNKYGKSKTDADMHELKRTYFNSQNKLLYRNLFVDPSIDHLDTMSIPELINDCIKRSDIDLRKDLARNIVLVGGTSKIPGLCSDLNNALNKIGKVKGLKYKISASRNREYSSWLGGSILSCLPTFDNHWIKNEK
jgi:centractin